MITLKIAGFLFSLWLLASFVVRGEDIIVGAERFDAYQSLISDKNVGMVVNHTTRVGDEHLVDFLLRKNVRITKIFTPEHGMWGKADAGEEINDGFYYGTAIPVISLYGSNKKPSFEDLKDIDVIIYDIQDVGVRFYTYISTMHLVMEACAENQINIILLDRPNPNGFYIDGPVLKKPLHSFVGMHPIPIVYGMTSGELAVMINDRGWLQGNRRCTLTVITVLGYDHNTRYSLPVKPSPNLPNDISVLLYPSLCLFEGTMMSVGRGTSLPFQVVGYPDSTAGDFVFIPEAVEGAKNPLFSGVKCFGSNYSQLDPVPRFTLRFLIGYYQRLGSRYTFFNDYFEKLAGNNELRQQIMSGFTEEEIRITWYKELQDFKLIRKKYLLYPDFE